MDDLDSLIAILRERSEHADVLIVNGGLGPTSDDLSALAAATAKGESLILHAEWLETMTRFFAERGRPMAESNRKQAEIPASAEMINNPVGTACGFAVQLNRCLMFFTPGVPSEFKVMVEQEILPPPARTLPAVCAAAVPAPDHLWSFRKRPGAKPQSAAAAARRGDGLPFFDAHY
ncbi:CinA-like protein [Raoultella terrigena]|uniref:CinA-like protein n=1 Tax=Raoultella terrigena TaxID=577 RepID=A0A3P8LZE9_RAOTE|nr:CinA-like protein [Raoultella terrigena]